MTNTDERDLMKNFDDKFNDKMKRIDDMLIKKLMEEGKTREEAEAMVRDLYGDSSKNENNINNNNNNKVINIGNTATVHENYKNKLKEAELMLEHVESCLFNRGRPNPVKIQKAFKLMHEVYRRFPEMFTGKKVYLWEALGWAYHILGDMRRADKCLRIQAALQPDNPDPYLNLGVFYQNGGMHSQAINIYMEGLELCPGHPYLLYNLSNLLYHCGMYEGYLTYYTASRPFDTQSAVPMCCSEGRLGFFPSPCHSKSPLAPL